MNKISIIVPVFNIEDYIHVCINSLLNQNTFEYEIILVDDGSTDKSGEICDAFSGNHNNIHVFHKENGGLSSARNFGIKKAAGDFILFVDGDDHVTENSIDNITDSLDKIQETDIYFLNGMKLFPNGKMQPIDQIDETQIIGLSKKEVLRYLASLPKFPGSACTKLIRREFLVDNDLYFPEGLLSEDIDWTLDVILKAESFGCISCPYYYYRQNRTGSITNTIGVNSIDSLFSIIEKWTAIAERHEYSFYIYSVLAYEFSILLAHLGSLSRKTHRALLDKGKSYCWLLSKGSNSKTRSIYRIFKIFGFDITRKLLALYLAKR